MKVGETVRVAGDAVTFCTTPSDHVTVQGVAPVRTAVIVVLWPAQIVAVPETTAVGGGTTVSTAVAVPPVPPSVEATFPVTFVLSPLVVPVTTTLTEQEAPGDAIAPPERVMVVAPAAGPKVPPQVFVADGVAATASPAGKASVTPIPVNPVGLVPGFVIVIVKVDGWFRRTVAGVKLFAIVGGATTV